MASSSNNNEVPEPPIILPILQFDPATLEFHNQKYQEMQNCVNQPINHRSNDNHRDDNQPIWSPAREIAGVNERMNQQLNFMSGPNVNSIQSNQDINEPHCSTSYIYVNSCVYSDNRAPENVTPTFWSSTSNMSASECLASYAKKLNNEQIHKTSMYSTKNIETMNPYDSEFNQPSCSKYSQVDDSTTDNFAHRADESDDDSDTSSDD